MMARQGRVCVSADLAKLSRKSARDCSESSVSRKNGERTEGQRPLLEVRKMWWRLQWGGRLVQNVRISRAWTSAGFVRRRFQVRNGVDLLLHPCLAGLQLEVTKRIGTAAGRKVFVMLQLSPLTLCNGCAKGRIGLQKLAQRSSWGSSEQRRAKEEVAQIRSSWEKRYLKEEVAQWRAGSAKKWLSGVQRGENLA